MKFTQWLWLIIINILSLGLGVLLTFFPGKVIRLRAKLQVTMFRIFGMNAEDIDRLPIYSWFFGEDYSKRLKSEQETPEKHKFFMVWTRILGLIILFFTLLEIWLVFLAVQSGNL